MKNMSTMRAIVQKNPGGPETLCLGETEMPKLEDSNQRLIKVEAFAINRADTLQREGKYPAPKGVTNILGLECAGYLVDHNTSTNEYTITDRKVMALLSGGGYAEYAKVHKDHIMDIPNNISLTNATSIPEVWLTAYQISNFIIKINKNDNVLIHGASSGVGTSLIQLIKFFGGNPIALCSGQNKIDTCLKLGAVCAIERKSEDKVAKILEFTNNKGCDAIFDCVGASEFDNNIKSAAIDCKWVQYGFLGGSFMQEFNLAKLMAKRISLNFSTLRSRTDDYKTNLVSSFTNEILPKFDKNEFSPIIDKIYNIEEIKEAHERMGRNENIGKILINWK